MDQVESHSSVAQVVLELSWLNLDGVEVTSQHESSH